MNDFRSITDYENLEGIAMICLMDHIVLNVEDDERMIFFYSKVLMLASERLEEYRAGKVPFPSVRMNTDTIIDLFPKKMWQKNNAIGKGIMRTMIAQRDVCLNHRHQHRCLKFSN
jgi:hypothetical protein